MSLAEWTILSSEKIKNGMDFVSFSHFYAIARSARKKNVFDTERRTTKATAKEKKNNNMMYHTICHFCYHRRHFEWRWQIVHSNRMWNDNKSLLEFNKCQTDSLSDHIDKIRFAPRLLIVICLCSIATYSSWYFGVRKPIKIWLLFIILTVHRLNSSNKIAHNNCREY